MKISYHVACESLQKIFVAEHFLQYYRLVENLLISRLVVGRLQDWKAG